MKDIKKKLKKLISVNRRDIWDKYWMSYNRYKDWKKEKLNRDTGGIGKGKRRHGYKRG